MAGYRLAFLVAAGVASLGVAAALYFFRQAKILIPETRCRSRGVRNVRSSLQAAL